MKRNLLLAASVAAIAAFSVPAFAESPAQAEDPDSTGQTQINPGAQQLNAEEPNQADTTTTGAIAVSDIETLSPVMAAGTRTAGQIQTITTVGEIKVVHVNDWASANKQAFDAAMSQNMKPINDLQAALAANTAVGARMTEQKVQATHVIASQVQPDGSLVLYVYEGA